MRQLAEGRTVHGHKVGLSSKVMQQMMGVDEPDYGHLLSDMVLAEETPSRRTATAVRGSRSRSATYSAGVSRGGVHHRGCPRGHRVRRPEPRTHRQPDQGLADRARRHHRRQRLVRRGDPRLRPGTSGRPEPGRHRGGPVPGRCGDRPGQHQRRARRPHRGRRVAGPQGRVLRGEAGSRSRDPAGVVHQGRRREAGESYRADFEGLGSVSVDFVHSTGHHPAKN